MFDRIIVPEEVHMEVLQGESKGINLKSYKQASWIEVKAISTLPDPLLNKVLDKGEASVIQLAREIPADYILIDERKGRKIARTVYELRVIGTVRILVDAKRMGILDNVTNALKLMQEGGYWIHDDIVEYALREAGEK
jgi:predicted nucleic acid-binding protein